MTSSTTIKKTILKELELSPDEEVAKRRRNNPDKTGAIGYSYLVTRCGIIMPHRMEVKYR